MKKIGFVDYYISEWHANNYPDFIADACKKTGDEFEVAYAWAEEYVSPVDGRNTDQWCEDIGVQRCETIDELCEKSDYIVVLSPDNPEKHLEYAKAVLKHGKNTYIDKTFAPDYATAKAIFDEAEKYGTKFFSTSALRYADEYEGVDCGGGLIVTGGGSKLDDYIIHILEIIATLIKSEPRSVKSTVQGRQVISNLTFADGMRASFVYTPDSPFSISVCDKEGKTEYKVLTSDFFATLITEILKFFKTGVLPFDSVETLRIMKMRDAVLKSVENDGMEVEI